MSRKREREQPAHGAVDCDLGSKRGVWLIKVALKTTPNLALPVSSSSTKKQPTFTEEHTLTFGSVDHQSLAVLSEDKGELGADATIKSGKLTLEGRVVRKAECRPPASDSYLKMKASQIEKSGQTERNVILLEQAVVNFKPVNMHVEDAARLKAKKEGSKAVRADRDVLMQALFHAFEKHQYYRLVDLQKLTAQPPGFVKEILQEIAVYNAAPPHKSMWELKPEYRNYSVKNK